MAMVSLFAPPVAAAARLRGCGVFAHSRACPQVAATATSRLRGGGGCSPACARRWLLIRTPMRQQLARAPCTPAAAALA